MHTLIGLLFLIGIPFTGAYLYQKGQKIMGGKPSKGTPADKRLKGNKTNVTPPGTPLPPATPAKKGK